MPTIDALTKTDRMMQLQLLLRRKPDGVRTSEVARLLDVSERTARRYMDQLTASGLLPAYRDKWTWKLVEGARFDLLPVRLDLDEAMALYLAARLLSAHSDKHNPHAVSAMNKLASAMPQAIGEHIVRTAEATARRREHPVYLRVLETLTLAWAERRQVRMLYATPHAEEVTERVFDPYFIEPSAVGYSCYAIGYDRLRGGIREFKVERIARADLLETTCEIRKGFDPYAFLANAWGVMGGEEVTEVKLRFTARVAFRIRESDWPGVVGVEEHPDGTCTMTLRVNHAVEMMPWIRGWGPDCEVLEPEDLRQQIAEEMKAAAAVYESERR